MIQLLISRTDVRDWAIILYSLLGAFLFFVGILFVVVLVWAVLAIKGAVNDIMNDSVKPTLGSIRETAESIKGTTDFVGQRAVSPIIRTYGMVAGLRKGLGVLTGLSRGRRR